MDHLTHIDEQGRAHMVDVGAKPETDRTATVSGFVRMLPTTLQAIREATARKGDVIATARIAGIMGAKRTWDLIPLCHPIPISSVNINFQEVETEERCGIAVEATVKTTSRTGIEMEALTAVSIACLTVYDMCKAMDRAMSIEDIRLEEKAGGASGDYRREH